MKNTILYTFISVFFYGSVFSQVGINAQTQKATLDIVASTTNGSKAEGIIAPRLTGDKINAADAQFGVSKKGTILYATATVTNVSIKTATIPSPGYYYGVTWKSLSGAISEMTGATLTVAGTGWIVPIPAAGFNTNFLKEETRHWQIQPICTILM
ncbi:hypothetical protein [Chryseobacterium candidae]|uniref:Uncharacterized protein n=1 Tax=Chryseobacterium candidae TaxID=1978493 RepID=A0ABY2R6Z0_9FLAO|nr:hypothetical protein [Chryseobacterium candidae]THV59384.1 hypothetical protein EK417_11175 [Chryseobacterium candidae]